MTDGPRLIPCNKQGIESAPLPAGVNVVYFFSPEPRVERNTIPPGMGLRVTRAGVRSFVLSYRAGKTQRRMTLGTYPHMGPLRAVREAKELRRAIAAGKDPMAEKRASRRAPAAPVAAPDEMTVNALLDQFMAEFERRSRRPQTYRSIFDLHVRPRIGSLPLSAVNRRAVAALLDQIEGGATKAQALTYLKSAMSWWAKRVDDYVPPKLSRDLAPPPAERGRVLDPGELRATWHVAGEMGAFGQAVRLLALTGCRKSEVFRMRRSEITEDLKHGKLWVIPAARMKAGKAHTVPLTQSMLDIIEAQPSGDLVFKPRSGLFLAAGEPMNKLRRKLAAAGYTFEWRLHDLRRTAATLMAERCDVPPYIIDECLAHRVKSDTTTTRTYNRYSYIAEKRDAFGKLDAAILQIVEGAADNVVPLREVRLNAE